MWVRDLELLSIIFDQYFLFDIKFSVKVLFFFIKQHYTYILVQNEITVFHLELKQNIGFIKLYSHIY